jgi:two-component system CheB/CheR fusion protein
MREKIIPQILKNREKDRMVRIWVPGCSTGEEAFSIAIAFHESLGRLKHEGFKVQIFATDVDKEAIEKSRQGFFPSNIAADISPERIENFFIKEDNGYRINKDIRGMVVFAPHNVIMDPPFTKLDLISCRNLLIYLTAELQRKLVPLFHYALNPGGFLFLGSSETVGRSVDMFTAASAKWKIYRKRDMESQRQTGLEFPVPYHEFAPESGEKIRKQLAVPMPELAQRVLLESFTPPAALINEKGDIIYLNGRTGKYLEPPAGKANMNIFAMAREGLRVELPGIVHKVIGHKKELSIRDVKVKTNGDYQMINLHVKPIVNPDTVQPLYMVVFEDMETPDKKEGRLKVKESSPSKLKQIIVALEKELRHKQELLQNSTEEMETSQEELKSMNEELQSTNEELQSTNEELTSSKEEMQSLNEELMTVNTELQSKIEELTLANNDMKNLLNRTEIATIFLDGNLNIRRYTPEITKIINLIPGDTGRPLSHIVTNLNYDELISDVKSVLDTLVYRETQVQTKDSRWYNMRIMPYRTDMNVIDGALLTFVDITAVKNLELSMRESEANIKEARLYAEDIMDAMHEPVVIVDEDLEVVSANKAFYDAFRMNPNDVLKRPFYEISGGQFDLQGAREFLSNALKECRVVEGYIAEGDFWQVGRIKFTMNAGGIICDNGKNRRIVITMRIE